MTNEQFENFKAESKIKNDNYAKQFFEDLKMFPENERLGILLFYIMEGTKKVQKMFNDYISGKETEL